MSEVWGTAYQLERDKATGNDPDSLRREIERLRAALFDISTENIIQGMSPALFAEKVLNQQGTPSIRETPPADV
jgi:hypothetical protein